jgi:phosphoribosylformimino-5-aminoimidazole carboxamide ribotide isomerase
MRFYPAIDILDGKAVRLTKGDFDARTVYEDDPLDAARSWVAQGARYLHIVDLDGAKAGSPQNLHHLERITRELDVPIQYGGGLRDLGAVRDALRAGAQRIVLGTAAFRDIDFLDEAVAAWGDRVVVSVDVRGGKVSAAGWQETTQMPADDAIRRLQDRGVRQFVYTNVDKDGMLEGLDLEEVAWIASIVRGKFIISGGVGSIDDLIGLKSLRQVNLGGVIAGKALYEKRFTVPEALAVLDG